MTDVPTIMKQVISRKPDAEYMSDLDATAAAAAHNKGDPGRLGVTVEIVVDADPPHGFNAGYRPHYRATDAIEGWRRGCYGVAPTV
jgi:hypothetical protein